MIIVQTPQFHGHLGPALFYLFAMIGVLIYAYLSGKKMGGESASEKRWREYATAHPNRNNKAGDPIKHEQEKQ